MGWTDGWTFDTSRKAHQQSFQEFMEFVRRSLGGAIVMQDARRLPPQRDDPEFQDLELRADEGRRVITLRLRTDNLYVVGFRNGQDQWFEFNEGGDRIIHGSTFLPFNGSYTGAGSMAPLDGVSILLPAIKEAVYGLAEHTGEVEDKLRGWLRTLIVSFIESIRFRGVADSVAATMRGGTEQLSDHLINQIRNWGSISTALIEAANDVVQDPARNIFQQFVRWCNIHNAYEAAAALGLVLITAKTNRAGPRRRYGRSADDDAGGYDDVALGITLLEVVSVVILNIDDEDPGDLYGTVRVGDSFGSENVFHRERSNVQSVSPGDHAELEWPGRAISAADDFVIDLDLKDRDRDLSPDDEVSRGQVVWISREAKSSHCNVVRGILVTGKDGSAQVNYAVVTNAVVATVEVLLINGDGESVPDVYGVVTATTEMAAGGGSLEYDLFRRASSEYVNVPVNTYIPLRRKVITAALGSPLKVEADLWDKDTFPDVSPDDQIALGSVEFEPNFQGEDIKEITGKYGKVEVHVTWSVTHEP